MNHRLLVIACLLAGLAMGIGCRRSPHTLFRLLPPSRTGIDFNNKVQENDSINPIDLEFLYNGGGVAVGDFNRDGLPDLYFTGSLTGNRLYLNRGNLHFEDVTDEAGVRGMGRWCNGATVVDINNDGWPDIYVCATISKDPEKRRNMLFINQGLDKNGVPVFKEEAHAYGLDDTGHSVMAAFFDYDHDGDLDMYLVETTPAGRGSSSFYGPLEQFRNTNSDKLFRNDWNDSLHHPVFTDVSAQAGIHDDGYGLSVDIADFNGDGWPDIYVDNDFMTNDLLYINNHNGTFTNAIKSYFRHTAQSAMGSDVGDINNDGLPDLVSVDMAAADNLRKKKNMPAENYFNFLNMIAYGYVIQFGRNVLQINQGPSVGEGDSVQHPVFSDVAYLAGVAETDWSWTPSLADFNNDGRLDLIITNGYPKDVTDHDFITYKQMATNLMPKQDILNHIPSIQVPNYAFENMGNLHFRDVTRAWGMDIPSFSNGGVYVDLDNDGDLDYVVNNINQPAFVFENTLNDRKHIRANFLRVQLVGDSLNRDAIGTTLLLYVHGQLQMRYHQPVRGYLSSVDPIEHFGLGKAPEADSLIVLWPNGEYQKLTRIPANQLLTLRIRDARYPPLDPRWASLPDHTLAKDTQALHYWYDRPAVDATALFTQITSQAGIHYVNQDPDYNDFFVQKLLPHKLSQDGPGIAIGDVDGNGLEDMLLGASTGYTPTWLLQDRPGHFVQKDFLAFADRFDRKRENRGVLIFDADGDGLPDLYLASGSVEQPAGSMAYADQFYHNKGHGRFVLDTAAIPFITTSKSCVIAADFNRDGKPDLFVGGRVEPGQWPKPVSSFILENESTPGHPLFKDVTSEVAPMLKNIGMVSAAIWTDFNNDGWPDLILVGEWMPVTFLENDHGHFRDVTAQTGLQHELGWWNSIVAGDFNNDGLMDYIVGNLGMNSYYRASHTYPMHVYAGDFDGNGTYDAIPTMFLPDSAGNRKEYPTEGRDDLIRQIPGLKRKFPSYRGFGLATIRDILSPEQLKNALILEANQFHSVYLENKGHGRFEMHPLPVEAQVAPVYGMVTGDFNGDGNLDIALCGNDYGPDPNTGRYDALNGLVLLGDGQGHFRPQSILQGGFYVPGDAKAMAWIDLGQGHAGLAVTQHNGQLLLFKPRLPLQLVPLKPDEYAAVEYLKNGRSRRAEVGWQGAFLSASPHALLVDSMVSRIDIFNIRGQKRTLKAPFR
ncbi:VCBS repeat protein [Thermoflavifilum aggregans]|uniref:VCBS repeat protein n=1 Tax=Thermoflavifilum aggregans TaxID=454188 RepID=A0A2M9CRJ3_9BACT|nr:VCBS repeat-containing protein [Thermoflavifilum aggregans]PJJ74509.1 VCBS repeat protein [Thermoflavifilum aggregans]